MNIILRQSKRFVVNKTILPESAKNSSTINGLYAALYDEFLGASEKEKYKNMTYQQRIQEVNTYAIMWLQKQGHKLNG